MHTLTQLQVVLRILLRRITAIELSGFDALNQLMGGTCEEGKAV
jgi:hypothetical protein